MKNLPTIIIALICILGSVSAIAQVQQTRTANFTTNDQSIFNAGPALVLADTFYMLKDNGKSGSFFADWSVDLTPKDINGGDMPGIDIINKFGIDFDMYARFLIDAGSADIEYPTTIKFSVPPSQTFGCGEEVTVNTSYTIDSGYKLDISEPGVEFAVGTEFNSGLYLGGRSCALECTPPPVSCWTACQPFPGTVDEGNPSFANANNSNYRNYLKQGNYDFLRVSTSNGIEFPWDLYGAPNPGVPNLTLPLNTDNIPNFENLTNISGTIDNPMNGLDGTDNLVGNAITDNSNYKFMHMEFDPLQFQEYFTHIPLTYSGSIGPMEIDIDIISVPLIMDGFMKGSFKFDPVLNTSFDFGKDVSWKEMNGSTVVQSGTSQVVNNFKIGNSLKFVFPDNQPMSLSPKVDITNEFKTKMDLNFNASVGIRIMSGHVKVDGVLDENFALVNETIPIGSFSMPVAEKTFAMGGFETKTLDPLGLTPDMAPPVVVTKSFTAYIPDAGGPATINPQDVIASAVDVNGGTIRYVSVTPNSFDCSKLGGNNVMVTVDDSRCNPVTLFAGVTIIDRTKPTVVCKTANVYLNNGGTGILNPFDVFGSGWDNCGTVSILALSKATFDCSNIGANTVVMTVTDGHNNNNTCAATVTVIDNIAPTVTCKPATVYLNNAGSASLAPTEVFQSGADNCGVVNMQSVGPNVFSCSNIGTTLVVLTVNDSHSNTASCTTTVTVLDKIVPTVVCKSATVDLNANGAGSISTASVFQSGADNCGVVNQESVMPNTFGCNNLGVNTVVLTVNDSHGNTNTCTATVTVRDLIKPVAICPANVVQNNDLGICGASVSYTATATDNCSIVSLVSTPVSGSLFNVGTTPVKYTATDVAGNTGTCTFSVTVKDTESPVITCPANVVLENELGKCSATATYAPATATDNCAVQSVVHAEGRASGLVFPVGVSYVTFRATDIYANSSTCSFSVEILDTEAPKMVCPMNLNKPNDFGDCGRRMQIIGTPGQLSDNCGVYGVTNDSPVNFPIGETAVIWTITDIHANTATCVQNVTIFDNDWPVVKCPSNMKIKTDEGYCEASSVNFNATATDNCPGVMLEYDTDLNYLFPVGYTNVEAKATDVYGHESKCVFQVIVETRPEICNGVDDDCDGIADEIQDWKEIFRAEAGNGQANDQLGSSVAIDGDWALMGAPGTGLAYLLRRNENDPTDWLFVKEFNNGTNNTDDLFGSSVSLQNGIAVVGAPNDDTKGNNAGAAHIFVQNPADAMEWSAMKTIYASDAAEAANFGKSLKVKGQTLMVGASGTNAAYVFNQNEAGVNNWGQSQKLAPSDATLGSEFGLSLDFDQQTAVVGAPNEGAGAVYAFDPANGWIETQKIQPAHGDAGDRFAQSISLEGKRLVIGTPGDDDKGVDAGAAYIFGKNQNGAFVQVNKIIDVALGTAGDEFGYSVSTRGDYLAVGAPSDDLRGKDAGAVHIFLREDGGWLPLIALTQQGSRNLDHFGYSLQLQPGSLIVGTPGDDIGTQLDRGSVAIFEGLCGPSNIGQRESEVPTATATASVTLSPNPTMGETSVQFALPAEESFTIRVFDMSGKLVLSREGQGQEGENTFPLNLTGFAAGVYVVDFQSEGLKGQKRLVVQE